MKPQRVEEGGERERERTGKRDRARERGVEQEKERGDVRGGGGKRREG